MAKPLALVIDDEPDICELLSLTLGRMDVDTVVAGDVAGAKAALGEQRFDICLTDMRLPDGDGIELVRHIQSHAPHLPVAVITAHGSMQLASDRFAYPLVGVHAERFHSRRFALLGDAAVGMALMACATICFVSMQALIRRMGGELPPVEVAFFRNLFGFLAIDRLLAQILDLRAEAHRWRPG